MNNPKLLKIALAVLLVLFVVTGIGALHAYNKLDKANKENEKNIQAAFDKRLSEFDAALRHNDAERKTLVHLLDSTTSRGRDLDRRDSITRLQISSIKGMYSKLDTTQLAQEMIKQFKER